MADEKIKVSNEEFDRIAAAAAANGGGSAFSLASPEATPEGDNIQIPQESGKLIIPNELMDAIERGEDDALRELGGQLTQFSSPSAPSALPSETDLIDGLRQANRRIYGRDTQATEEGKELARDLGPAATADAGALGGMRAGARIGAQLPLGPHGKIVGGTIGAIGGGLLGSFGGELGSQLLSGEDVDAGKAADRAKVEGLVAAAAPKAVEFGIKGTKRAVRSASQKFAEWFDNSTNVAKALGADWRDFNKIDDYRPGVIKRFPEALSRLEERGYLQTPLPDGRIAPNIEGKFFDSFDEIAENVQKYRNKLGGEIGEKYRALSRDFPEERISVRDLDLDSIAESFTRAYAGSPDVVKARKQFDALTEELISASLDPSERTLRQGARKNINQLRNKLERTGFEVEAMMMDDFAKHLSGKDLDRLHRSVATLEETRKAAELRGIDIEEFWKRRRHIDQQAKWAKDPRALTIAQQVSQDFANAMRGGLDDYLARLPEDAAAILDRSTLRQMNQDYFDLITVEPYAFSAAAKNITAAPLNRSGITFSPTAWAAGTISSSVGGSKWRLGARNLSQRLRGKPITGSESWFGQGRQAGRVLDVVDQLGRVSRNVTDILGSRSPVPRDAKQLGAAVAATYADHYLADQLRELAPELGLATTEDGEFLISNDQLEMLKQAPEIQQLAKQAEAEGGVRGKAFEKAVLSNSAENVARTIATIAHEYDIFAPSQSGYPSEVVKDGVLRLQSKTDRDAYREEVKNSSLSQNERARLISQVNRGGTIGGAVR